VLILAGAGTALWIHADSLRSSTLTLPATLLSMGKDTGSNAAAQERTLESQARNQAFGELASPVAGLYGDLPGPAFEVVVGRPCPSGGCLLPTSSQVVQSMRQAGFSDARAFPVGSGVTMVCRSEPFESTSLILCTWLDQLTFGRVLFAREYSSSMPDAAAKTKQIRLAVER
jgi:hypothetical protein